MNSKPGSLTSVPEEMAEVNRIIKHPLDEQNMTGTNEYSFSKGKLCLSNLLGFSAHARLQLLRAKFHIYCIAAALTDINRSCW